MALSSPGSQDTLYRVHIITGMPLCSHAVVSHIWQHQGHGAECCACLARLSMQPCRIEYFANFADGGLKTEDLQGLEKSSIFLFILHSPNPIAAPLFAPCSTQRLYLHEHADFDGIGDVSPHTFHPIVSHAMLTATLLSWQSSGDALCRAENYPLPWAALFSALLSNAASPVHDSKARSCCKDMAGIL